MKHFEKTILIPSSPKKVFSYADNHENFSAHMNKSSWMMGGGKMLTSMDSGLGKQVGSHIKMAGKVFEINVFLDEIIVTHEPYHIKIWETVGNLKLLVIGHHKMGFEITPQQKNSTLRVFIDFDLPTSNTWLGHLFGKFYAKWCVNQMVDSVFIHFTKVDK